MIYSKMFFVKRLRYMDLRKSEYVALVCLFLKKKFHAAICSKRSMITSCRICWKFNSSLMQRFSYVVLKFFLCVNLCISHQFPWFTPNLFSLWNWSARVNVTLTACFPPFRLVSLVMLYRYCIRHCESARLHPIPRFGFGSNLKSPLPFHWNQSVVCFVL